MNAGGAADFRTVSKEVLYSSADVATVDRSAVQRFKTLAAQNERRRVRLCTHLGADDPLHEMVIVHEKGVYVPPHKHPGKKESMHIIEGSVDVVLFDEDGEVREVVAMGDFKSGRRFYLCTATPMFHTLIVRSDVLIFHETTEGPFHRDDTVFARWAPADGDTKSIMKYITALEQRIAQL